MKAIYNIAALGARTPLKLPRPLQAARCFAGSLQEAAAKPEESEGSKGSGSSSSTDSNSTQADTIDSSIDNNNNDASDSNITEDQAGDGRLWPKRQMPTQEVRRSNVAANKRYHQWIRILVEANDAAGVERKYSEMIKEGGEPTQATRTLLVKVTRSQDLERVQQWLRRFQIEPLNGIEAEAFDAWSNYALREFRPGKGPRTSSATPSAKFYDTQLRQVREVAKITNQVERKERLDKLMEEWDFQNKPVSVNAQFEATRAYLKVQDRRRANERIEAMNKARQKLSEVEWLKLLRVCATLGDVKSAEVLVQKAAAQGAIIIQPILNCVLEACAKRDQVEDLRRWIRLSEDVYHSQLDLAGVNLCMAVFVKHRLAEDAREMVERCKQQGVRLNSLTYTYLIRALPEEAESVQRALTLVRELPNELDGLVKSDVFNAALEVCVKQKNLPALWETFDLMEESGVHADYLTYRIIAALYSACGDVERMEDLNKTSEVHTGKSLPWQLMTRARQVMNRRLPDHRFVA